MQPTEIEMKRIRKDIKTLAKALLQINESLYPTDQISWLTATKLKELSR